MFDYNRKKQQGVMLKSPIKTIADFKVHNEGQWHFLYDSNVYMFRMLKILGILPLNREKNGKYS